MKELTDSMISSTNSFTIVVAIVVGIFVIGMAVFSWYYVVKKDQYSSQKVKKIAGIVLSIVIALIVVGDAIFVINAYKKIQDDDWYIEVMTVKEKEYRHSGTSNGRGSYKIKFNEYGEYISIDYSTYNKLDKGDKAYVVVNGSDYQVYSFDEYKYVGDRLKK